LRSLYPLGRKPVTYCAGGCLVSRAGGDECGEEKIFFTYRNNFMNSTLKVSQMLLKVIYILQFVNRPVSDGVQYRLLTASQSRTKIAFVQKTYEALNCSYVSKDLNFRLFSEK
jgi:hypothetical protein